MLVHHVTLPEFSRGPPGRAKNPIQSTSPDSNRGNLTTDEKKLSTSIPPKVHHHAPGRQTPPRKQFETPHETTYPPIYERKDVGPADDPRARDAVREQAPLAQEHRAEAGRVAVEELQAARSQVGAFPPVERIFHCDSSAGIIHLELPIGIFPGATEVHAMRLRIGVGKM